MYDGPDFTYKSFINAQTVVESSQKRNFHLSTWLFPKRFQLNKKSVNKPRLPGNPNSNPDSSLHKDCDEARVESGKVAFSEKLKLIGT